MSYPCMRRAVRGQLELCGIRRPDNLVYTSMLFTAPSAHANHLARLPACSAT